VRLAVVDIGSNTANCAVYERAAPGALDRLDESSEPLKLMRRLGPDGVLSPAVIERVLGVLRGFRTFARGLGADEVIALATSAVRDARNSGVLRRAAERELGFALRVIDGAEEGELAAIATAHLLPVRDGVVMDLGGGSAQFVELVDGRPGRTASLPLGALRLTDAFGTAERVSAEKVLALRAHVDAQLATVDWLAGARGPLVGVGGTIRALGKVDRKARSWPIPHGHGHWLSREDLERTWEWTSRLDADARREVPGLPNHRAETIVAGALVYMRVLALRGLHGLRISSYGVREGAALRHFEGDRLPLAAGEALRAELRARWPRVPEALEATLRAALTSEVPLEPTVRDGLWIAAWARAARARPDAVTERPVHGVGHDEVAVAADLMVEGVPRVLPGPLAQRLRALVRVAADAR
jgi:exopolyphosphatase/guanosine-5'-triphosphate,3'-diphosphate pyrophosphatase